MITAWTTNGLPSARTWLPRTVRVWPCGSGTGASAHFGEYGGTSTVDALAGGTDAPLHATATVRATALAVASAASTTVRDRVLMFAPLQRAGWGRRWDPRTGPGHDPVPRALFRCRGGGVVQQRRCPLANQSRAPVDNRGRGKPRRGQPGRDLHPTGPGAVE